MHINSKSRFRLQKYLRRIGIFPFLLLVFGCANPGPPRPPSLSLPASVTDLHALRIGEKVELTWTNSAQTTDDLPVKPPLSAEICRDMPAPAAHSSAACTPVGRTAVNAGEGTFFDPLPPALLSDPVTVIVYHVRLLNSRGRSAGISNPAMTVTGAAPAAVADLTTIPAAGGLRLEWRRASQPAAAVILERTSATPVNGNPQPSRKITSAKSSDTVHLLGSPQGADSGGAIDNSTQRDAKYIYVAHRERTVTLNSSSFVLQSIASSPLTVTVRDVTPPATPAGLEAVAFGSSVDLSWEPNVEPDLAGYLVERTQLAEPVVGGTDTWQSLTRAPGQSPAFHDSPPASSARYRYRVSAIDTSGNRSAPAETPPVQVHPDPAKQ